MQIFHKKGENSIQVMIAEQSRKIAIDDTDCSGSSGEAGTNKSVNADLPAGSSSHTAEVKLSPQLQRYCCLEAEPEHIKPTFRVPSLAVSYKLQHSGDCCEDETKNHGEIGIESKKDESIESKLSQYMVGVSTSNRCYLNFFFSPRLVVIMF